MKLKQLSEVLWQFYSDGRPKATDQRLSERDVRQLVMMAFGGLLRKKHYESKAQSDFGEADFSITSDMLQTIEFDLSEPNTVGMRRADMDEYDLYRLPNNMHLANVYPIGGTCGSEELGKITPIKPGEESYYSKPKFKSFLFYVLKGRGVNIYNLPPCVSKVGIETTYNSNDVDVSLDICYDIAIEVFGVLFKEKQFPVKVLDNNYDINAIEFKRRLQEQANYNG